MKHATLLISAVLVLSLPAAAHGQTAQIRDEAGDVIGAGVAWDGRLTLTIAYEGETAPEHRIDVLVSSAARDVHDPSVRRCDPRVADAVRITAEGRTAVLRAASVPDGVRSQALVHGFTVTYSFDSPALAAVAEANPFVCVSGAAGGDEFFGAFAGRTLFVTPSTARGAVLDELARRYGGSHPATARCPRLGVGEGSAFCAFMLRRPRTYRMGTASTTLDHGRMSVRLLRNRVFPNALKYCGTSLVAGRWTQPPTFGFSVDAWAQGVSCRTARRLADRGRSALGFRCRAVSSDRTRTVIRCTKRGGRLVRIEAAE